MRPIITGRLFMDEQRLITVRQWFKKAESDFKTIKNNFKDEEPPTDAICFHVQQAIEKYLKGTLIYFGDHITKTHDLVSLLTSIADKIPELKELEDDLDEISRYGVEVRYPDVIYDPSIEEANKAYAIAIKVKEIIMLKIKI